MLKHVNINLKNSRWIFVFLAIIFTFIASCSNDHSVLDDFKQQEEAQLTRMGSEGEWVRFELDIANKQQDLEVNQMGEKEIDVKLSIQGSCSLSATGVAKMGADADLDIMETPSGDSIPVDTYFMTEKPNCSFNIYLESLSRYAWVTGGCNDSCYFNDSPMNREVP